MIQSLVFLGLKKGGDYVLWRYWFRKYRTDTEEAEHDNKQEPAERTSSETPIEGSMGSNTQHGMHGGTAQGPSSALNDGTTAE